ncbi:MAG TPA: CHRD domain-containing protein [Prolixibacteraceae bacterium]
MKTIIKFFTKNAPSVGIAVLVLFVGLSSCKKDDAVVTNGLVNYSGSFVKSGDAVVTSATGTTTGSFNPTTYVLTYTVTWNGLTSNAAAMHFHDAGPVIIPITGFSQTTSGSYSGTATFTADQAADLAAGKIYVQIHSVNIPAGEIKATLSKVSTPSSSGGY